MMANLVKRETLYRLLWSIYLSMGFNLSACELDVHVHPVYIHVILRGMPTCFLKCISQSSMDNNFKQSVRIKCIILNTIFGLQVKATRSEAGRPVNEAIYTYNTWWTWDRSQNSLSVLRCHTAPNQFETALYCCMDKLPLCVVIQCL